MNCLICVCVCVWHEFRIPLFLVCLPVCVWDRNLVHGSDSEASAAREIALWFSPEELYDWQPISEQWMY